jgi:hypothetical protein
MISLVMPVMKGTCMNWQKGARTMTIEEAIRNYEESERINRELAKNCESALAKNHNLDNAEKCRQMIAWLRELQERRKADSCEGCVYEEGSFLRCVKCKRNKKYYDRYDPGRRTDEVRTP